MVSKYLAPISKQLIYKRFSRFNKNLAFARGFDYKRAPVQLCGVDMAIPVFVAYAHADEAYRKELVKHLGILEKQKLISIWHDGLIPSGAKWEVEIERHLLEARLVVFLISADFFHSEYCHEKEMKRAMERHEHGEARVVPVIVRPCGWKRTDIACIQALPMEAKPVNAWKDQDEAWLNVVDGIEAEVLKLMEADAHAERERRAQAQEEAHRLEQERAEEEARRLEQERAEEEARRLEQERTQLEGLVSEHADEERWKRALDRAAREVVEHVEQVNRAEYEWNRDARLREEAIAQARREKSAFIIVVWICFAVLVGSVFFVIIIDW